MNCGAHHDIAECERCSQHYIDYEMMILCCVITVKSAGIMGLSQLDFEDLRGYAIMIKVLFICHGNICRSPMAEFVMKNWYPTQILPIISDRFRCHQHRGDLEWHREPGLSAGEGGACQARDLLRGEAGQAGNEGRLCGI